MSGWEWLVHAWMITALVVYVVLKVRNVRNGIE